MKKKILIVFGTRPEAIKLAPVIKQLKQASDHFETKVVLTAQHREIVDPILDFFSIIPDHDLSVMKYSQSPFDVTVGVLQKIQTIYQQETPGLVIVQGDTTSALAAALGAFYEKISLAHVEAGLRTVDRYNPFPEEMNRRLISQLANIHFAATPANRENLLRENIAPETIFVTGNPVIDALYQIINFFREENDLPQELSRVRGDKKIILLTTHRRENFGVPQQNIFEAVNFLVERHPDIQIVFPVHPNPAVLKAVEQHLHPHPNILTLEPLNYISFIRLMHLAHLILTDSGGIQEEAPVLGKPVLVLRATTEREELLESGNGILTGTGKEQIIQNVEGLLTQPELYSKMAGHTSPFGEGNAAQNIADILRMVKK
jgi:UDP-N-acetylglucosamine 2-epimerase (non-hydrolysing)